MKIEIAGRKIKLVPRDVRIAKRLVRNFLSSVKTKSKEQGVHTFYYTLICVMYVMAHDQIESVTPDVLSLILNARASSEGIED